jgi:hypothetical protein
VTGKPPLNGAGAARAATKPTGARLHNDLGLTLERLGELERAVEQASRALDLALERGAPEATLLELEHSLEVIEASLATPR